MGVHTPVRISGFRSAATAQMFPSQGLQSTKVHTSWSGTISKSASDSESRGQTSQAAEQAPASGSRARPAVQDHADWQCVDAIALQHCSKVVFNEADAACCLRMLLLLQAMSSLASRS